MLFRTEIAASLYGSVYVSGKFSHTGNLLKGLPLAFMGESVSLRHNYFMVTALNFTNFL